MIGVQWLPLENKQKILKILVNVYLIQKHSKIGVIKI